MKSAKQVSEFINEYSDLANKQEVNTADMFGGKPYTKLELIDKAQKNIEQRAAEENATLFDRQNVPDTNVGKTEEKQVEPTTWQKFGHRVFWDKGLPFRIVNGYTVGQMIEYCKDMINDLKSKGKTNTHEYADLVKEVDILENIPQKDVDIYDNYVKGYWTEDDKRTFAEYEKRKDSTDDPHIKYSLQNQYSIDSDIRESAKAKIKALWNSEELKSGKDIDIPLGRFSPHVIQLLHNKFGLNKINNDSKLNLKLTELKHIKDNHKDLTVDDIAALVDVFDNPDWIGYSSGHRNGTNLRFLQEGKNGDKIGISIYGGRKNIGNIKTFYVSDRPNTIKQWKQSGVHLEAVAKPAYQSNNDGPGANPALIESSTTPDNTIPQSPENASTLSENFSQKFSSAKTSLDQVPAGMKMINFKSGTTNLDIGGGKFDTSTQYLNEKGVQNLVFDPFNRNAAHNAKVFEQMKSGVDTVTCNNVLNVIAEPAMRSNVILQAAKALKSDGTAYFTVYEGNASGTGRQSQNDAWQNNRKTADYMDEIKQHFSDVVRHGKLIIAQNPILEGKESVWSMDGSQENSRKFSLQQNRSAESDTKNTSSLISPTSYLISV